MRHGLRNEEYGIREEKGGIGPFFLEIVIFKDN